MNKIYIVTAVDTSESANGKARVLGAFKNEYEAKAYVENDIADFVDAAAGMYDIICSFDKMNVWAKDHLYGCEWNIEAVEVQ